jgi:hypothetical protein
VPSDNAHLWRPKVAERKFYIHASQSPLMSSTTRPPRLRRPRRTSLQTLRPLISLPPPTAHHQPLDLEPILGPLQRPNSEDPQRRMWTQSLLACSRQGTTRLRKTRARTTNLLQLESIEVWEWASSAPQRIRAVGTVRRLRQAVL